MTPHQQQLIADNEAKRKEMKGYAISLYDNRLITFEYYSSLIRTICDKYNAIEKTIKENKE